MSDGLVKLVLPDVRDLLQEGSPEDIAEAFERFHSADIGRVLEGLPEEEGARLLLGLQQPQQTETFEQLEPATQLRLAEQIPPERLGPVVAAMSPDDRADFLGALPSRVATAVVKLLPPAERRDVARLIHYEDETAGGLMTSDFVSLRPEWTVQEAIDHLRQVAKERETITALYVVDADRFLRGVVTMRQLILSDPDVPLSDVMIAPPISMNASSDQESVLDQLRHYDFVSLPIVDDDGHMLGIVTHDDILDVAMEEADEDAHLMAAVEPLEHTYMATGVVTLVRKRAVWLTVLFITGLVAGSILRGFEETLQRTVALIFFLPLIIASGGNSGSQSATLVTRGLATGDVELQDWWRIVQREMASGIMLGTLLGVLGLGVTVAWGLEEWQAVAATVGATLVAIVTVGSLLGSLLPIVLKRMDIDPAITSAPLVAALVDVIGILIYVLVAGFFVPSL